MPTPAIEFTPRERVELLRKQKASLQRQRQRLRVRWWHLPLAATIGGVAIPTIALIIGEQASLADVLLQILAGVAAGAVLVGFVAGYFALLFSILERTVDSQLLKAGAAELQETIEQDFVTKLVQINFKYLDQYYEQTQSQANKSFALSAFAALVGLAIVATGIAMMFRGIVTPAYVTAAAGVASQFIAAVFFYLYNRTITKMADYHNKLVVTQNVSLALKIADSLEGNARTEAHQKLVDRLSDNVNLYLTHPEGTPSSTGATRSLDGA